MSIQRMIGDPGSLEWAAAEEQPQILRRFAPQDESLAGQWQFGSCHDTRESSLVRGFGVPAVSPG